MAQQAADEPEPQPVLAFRRAAVFLVVSVNDRPGAAEKVRDAAADINALVRAVGFRQSSAELSCVVGFGSSYWDRIRPSGSPRPSGLHEFRPITGAGHDAPATPGDVLFHIRADRPDLTFELSRQIMAAIGRWVTVQDHVTGFRYFDARDLLGFVDGTENPTGRAATDAALVGDADPDYRNGSYDLCDRAEIPARSWCLAGAVDRTAGTHHRPHQVRRHRDRRRCPGRQFARHAQHDRGRNRRGAGHFRDNMVFGDAGAGEYGPSPPPTTTSGGPANDPAITEVMLHHMFVGNPAGNYDHILDVSAPVTGSLFFVPSLDLLETLADDEITQSPDDGSLRIGGLKGETAKGEAQ